MTRVKNNRDLVEVFGYAPDDLTPEARNLWQLGACPFLGRRCSKTNHDQTITYGTCSVTSPEGDIIICPNRLYANRYETLRRSVIQCYGSETPMLLFSEYVERRNEKGRVAVALGMNSGKEVRLARSLSMDWVIALIECGKLVDYVGVEVQSIDITGNYRDTWHAYKNFDADTLVVPSSGHGLNWANVHKRLIPQIIRKGLVYSRSNLVTKGLFFIAPDIVYRKFEDVVGADIPKASLFDKNTITVHTYGLDSQVQHGKQRQLLFLREVRFTIDDFSNRFITGPNLPQGEELDKAVKAVLGIT
jgi:hypothetical protein